MTTASTAAAKQAALVLSDGHSLLPFAHRLVREGLEVEVAVVHSPPRYQQAWAGKFKPFLEVRKGGMDDETRAALLQLAKDAGAYIITNSRALSDAFKGHAATFGRLASPEGPPTALAVGAWWDGAGFSGEHLWVRDLGLWPGGAGPAALAGGTLVRLEGVPAWATAALASLATTLQEHNFKGLVAVDVLVQEGPKVVPTGRWEAGWPFGHTHAFVADQASLGGILGGFEPSFPKRYTQVVVVSVPPWPTKCNVQPRVSEIRRPDGEPLGGAELGATFWHDMQLGEGRAVQVAGLDGLVAVCRGSADHPGLATQRALRVAQAIALPERQLRTDVGVAAQQVLLVLEELSLLT